MLPISNAKQEICTFQNLYQYLREIHTHNDNDRQTKSKITKKQQSIFYYLTNITNAIVTKDLSKQTTNISKEL